VKPLHHPSEAVLTDYAAGALRPAFAITAAAHIDTCPACRERVRLLEQVGGQLISELPGTEMAADSLEHALARLDQPKAPPPARRGRIADRVRFGRRRFITPQIWVRHADRNAAGGDLLYLLRIPPGVRAANHGHRGQEFTAVLKGAYRDESGVFRAGDFAEFNDGEVHQPKSRGREACICLIASEKPMRMHDWVGRVVQALTGT
jgi:putative transcriptional regulator